ncbi:uncharacterized protein LOC107477941 [Arachis duranensis]|uniref:Uncharacterized protein LOC107477941 n=1 Tax=Arachis duranensis TaxID=130453 RepID=A0A6P4CR04_ARADU|nr:uncharacterized protein LOC107477941 [Arachis duranensis]
MRCDNNKHQDFQLLALEKENKSRDYNLFFPPAATHGAQPTIKSVLQSKEIVEKYDTAIARWMMDASVLFNAVNSAYYQSIIDAIANMGAGYKWPNYGRVHGYLLSKLVEDVKKMIEDYRKTDDALFKLLRDVLFVGSENVVHVVMDNATNYVAAGRLLESKFPILYWYPCATYCVNLMLQDIGKLQEFTGGREILHPAPTRFATNFIALQSILAQKDALRAMLTEPFVRVLHIVDSEDRAAMGFLYQAMYKAREEMVKRFQKRKRVVDPYFKILDSRWDSQLKRNLYATSYWLNLAFRFNSTEFDKHKQTTSNLLDVIERYDYSDADLNTKLTSETRIFKNAEGDFGSQNRMRKQSYDQICLDAFEDHLEWIMEDSPPFLTPEEVDALRNDLANMSLQSALDDLDQLNLEDDRDDDEANNNSVKNANQNETNQHVAPDLLDEERYLDFEITPWI